MANLVQFKFIRIVALCLLPLILPSTQTLATPEGPPLRTGLWVTQKLPTGDDQFAELAAQLKTNPKLSGVSLHIPWEGIEKESGKPDFTALDRTLEVFRQAKTKYQLCLKPGASTPQYLYTEGAPAFESRIRNPHRRNAGESVKIPVPWDSIYQGAFSRIIKQLGKRYASDPLCVGVVLTCANFLSAEMHLPKTPSDLTRWEALGDYQSRLQEVYRKYTVEWAEAFPRQEVCLHVSKVLDLPPAFLQRIVENGVSRYPRRFSIQNCQLNGRRENSGMMTYDLIMKYRDRVHHGFQSVAALDGADGRMGSAEMAALNIVHAEGEYWELWHGDGFSVETSRKAAHAWQEAKTLGETAYRKKLVSEGKYRQQR